MKVRTIFPPVLFILVPAVAWGGTESPRMPELLLVLSAIVIGALFLTLLLAVRAFRIKQLTRPRQAMVRKQLVSEMDESMLTELIATRSTRHKTRLTSPAKLVSVLILLLMPLTMAAEPVVSTKPLIEQPGIVITLLLIAIPLVFAVVFSIVRAGRLLKLIHRKNNEAAAAELADYLQHAEDEEIDAALLKRKSSVAYQPPSILQTRAVAGDDVRGIVHSVNEATAVTIVAEKVKQHAVRETLPQGKLILWYLGSAVFWLIFGTTVGEYLGIKFVAPDADSISWLSFGRLRPVHTNAVFWGWSSLAMLGLAYYVIPKVSNTTIASVKKGWVTLWLINGSVTLGTLSLMSGINNGGGEYREYTWPVMALFGAGLVITLINFLQTISRRKSAEIYISNWYIVSAIIFTLVIAFIAYWPTWQSGLGETIVQGYYMHQGVGMWFMLFNLGLVYYFLPQQLNRPIYSYGLGILAFWSQIVFYTLIGTHHFVFSSIPWWLQTVAIVGSAGMVIPVVAGTTNFFMTFNGAWHKLSGSYTLPFFFTGILFYFTGSLQGTAEAFRYTNLLWHFTDFTVAHSHLTMYGIIAFLLWGCIYVLVPRITGKEPSQLLTGIHFWLAFIGLMFYTIPLMIGGTLKGLSWMEGDVFINSVKLMAPFWLWRAIGGTLMWLAHLVFAVNFFRMVVAAPDDVKTLAIQKLKERISVAAV